MKNVLPILLITIVWCGAFLTAITPALVTHSSSLLENYLYFSVAPILFAFTFITLAAGLSLVAQRKIIRGVFPRKPFDKIYFFRRIYGTCWTQVFYFKPLYAIALSIPWFKKYMFRFFGYRHSTNFVVYPDTWIRDLPVLKIGEGAYLSNRATIGTNICLSDGNILVDAVEIDEKGLVGHLAILAPGAKIGKRVEVGVSATIAIRTQLNDGCKIHPCCMINHGAVVGEETKVGTMSYIGVKAIVGPNLNIPAGANISAGSIINTQEDMDKFFHSETKKMEDHSSNLRELFKDTVKHELKV